jgi:hypothetical protein
MDLRKFKESYFTKSDGQLFIFDESWDSFRPLNNLAWNGSELVIDDQGFKKSIFKDDYGFGNFKQLCHNLNKSCDIDSAKSIDSTTEFWKWVGNPTEWFFDRPCVFLYKCSNRNKESWLKFVGKIGSRIKTLRRAPKSLMRR